MLQFRCERFRKTLDFKIRSAQLKLLDLLIHDRQKLDIYEHINRLTAVKHLVSSICAHRPDRPLRIGAQSSVGNVIIDSLPFKPKIKSGFYIIDNSDLDLLLTKLEQFYGR